MNFDIEKRRKELKLTLEQVGNFVGVSKSTVKKWETGYIENMKRDKIALLAEILQVSPLEIMGIESNNEKMIITGRTGLGKSSWLESYIKPVVTKKFPMLGEIACGQPIYADRDYETYIEASADIQADFCLTAKGDSMINARIFDGDIVFIRSQSDVYNGEIAAIIIENDVTLKRVYKYENRLELRPENPTHPVQNYEGAELEQIHILGKAVAFQSYIR